MGTGHRKDVSANGTNDEMAANANIHTVISTRYITTCNINYILDFWSNSPINVCHGNIYYIFGHVRKVTFVIVNFLVMFTDFGHIHLVILIWSSE